jgi:hypothetical protein
MASSDVHSYYLQPSYRGRAFHVVINDAFQPSFQNHLQFADFHSNINFYCFCDEIAPTTEHKHQHCYMEFINPIKLSSLINFYSKMFNIHPWVAGCYRDRDANLSYLSKQGTLQFVKSPAQQSRLSEQLQMTANELVASDPTFILKNAVPFFTIKKNLIDDYDPIDSLTKKYFGFGVIPKLVKPITLVIWLTDYIKKQTLNFGSFQFKIQEHIGSMDIKTNN